MAIQIEAGPAGLGVDGYDERLRAHCDLIETSTRETLPLPVTGAILCGGRSSRMGRQKAFLPFGGSTLIQKRFDDLREFLAEVLLVANDTETYSHLGADVVRDIIPNRGPLVGILSALLVARHNHVLIIACDMPLVDNRLLRDMAAHRHGTDALVLEHSEGLEPLLGIYSRRCIQPLEESIFSGSGRVVDFLAGMNTSTYKIPAAKLMCGNLPVYFNVNTPADYSRVITAGT